jgi:hypothetical protein
MSELVWSRNAACTDVCKTQTGLLVGTIVYNYYGRCVVEHEYRATVVNGGGAEKCFDDALDAKRWVEEQYRKTKKEKEEKQVNDNNLPVNLGYGIPHATEMAKIHFQKTLESARVAIEDIVSQLVAGKLSVSHVITEEPQVADYITKAFKDKGYRVERISSTRNEPPLITVSVPDGVS